MTQSSCITANTSFMICAPRVPVCLFYRAFAIAQSVAELLQSRWLTNGRRRQTVPTTITLRGDRHGRPTRDVRRHYRWASCTNELGPLNRINHQLSGLANDLAVVEAFSHCIVFKTDDGLVTFDTSNEHGGKSVSAPFSRGHMTPSIPLSLRMDTLTTSVAVVRSARYYEGRKPTIVGHENVAARFDRYRMTNGYNHVINERQFGQFKRRDTIWREHHTFFLSNAQPRRDLQ